MHISVLKQLLIAAAATATMTAISAVAEPAHRQPREQHNGQHDHFAAGKERVKARSRPAARTVASGNEQAPAVATASGQLGLSARAFGALGNCSGPAASCHDDGPALQRVIAATGRAIDLLTHWQHPQICHCWGFRYMFSSTSSTCSLWRMGIAHSVELECRQNAWV